ncbi:Thioredoxin-like protein 1 [Colletotrichum spinosum]|uniref:Thioredoxin-like protein 1 n=1 Tax=Colletotrichum spinosum TaxID=1347390 RepID=A0A4R8PM48_9PEZI|nr:Thioredoxin-like protein 1 [Colletotrichum spinosum]
MIWKLALRGGRIFELSQDERLRNIRLPGYSQNNSQFLREREVSGVPGVYITNHKTPKLRLACQEANKAFLRTGGFEFGLFVYADWCGPCKTIAPFYEQLSASLSRKDVVTFVKIDVEAQKDIAKAYNVTSLPTFMIFREGTVLEKIQGADPRKLQEAVKKLGKEVESGSTSGASGSSTGESWRGAALPRGYGDVTDQVETKGCELLNADEDFGPVRTLFDKTKPSALAKKEGAKDWVESGADDQLLLFMPFQSMIKLHTLQLTSLPPTDDDDDDVPMRPGTIHLYTNKPHNLDFSEADDTTPTQAITLTEKDWNADGTATIGLRFVKFQNINSLILYVTKGDGDGEKVRLDRVRLIGESGEKREMGKLEKIGDEAGE